MLIKLYNFIYINKLIPRFAIFGAFLLIGCYFCNRYITTSAAGQLYYSVESIPYNDVGVVPGTRMQLKHGSVNLFFKYRMQAATNLYKAGKIKYILVSGDNHITTYDEATDMKEYLVSLGIPKECITLDYAGFRTLDTVIRANKVFGQKKFTFISQKFHDERALFLCRNNQIDAIALVAKDSPHDRHTKIREFFARVKAVLDVIFHTRPKFLGNKVALSICD